MGIADVRKAFEAGLSGAAQVKWFTMRYAKEDFSRTQVIEYELAKADGSTVMGARNVAHGSSLADRLKQIGAEVASELNGG